MVKPLTTLLQTVPSYTLSGPTSPKISGIAFDSRKVQPGYIFVAFKGLHLDGHDYIDDAIRNGAAAIVVETDTLLPNTVTAIRVPNGREAMAYMAAAWHDYPSRKMIIVGVTGTDGKTSTINLIFSILRAAGRNVGMISTVSAVINDESLDTGLHVTTPEAIDVQHYMAQMVTAGVDICLLESTSHGLAQHRVSAVDFDLAVVSNITHEHLNHHNNSLDEYRLAKARLFDTLAQRAAILNKDDWSFDFLQNRIGGRIPVISYGLAEDAVVRASNVDLSPDMTRFAVELPTGQPSSTDLSLTNLPRQTLTIETPLVGAFNVSNILAAIATTVISLNVAPQQAVAALRTFAGVPGRMERIDMGQPFTALVDFAHAPGALQNALETVRALTPGRVIAIFGCAGLRDVEKRTMMGHIAADLADITIITAEDPRTEDLDTLIDTTASAMQNRGAIENTDFYRIADRGRAIFTATQIAKPGDIVIALGKGHEQSMCFGTTEYPWDDREAMKSALSGEPLLTLPTKNWATSNL